MLQRIVEVVKQADGQTASMYHFAAMPSTVVHLGCSFADVPLLTFCCNFPNKFSPANAKFSQIAKIVKIVKIVKNVKESKYLNLSKCRNCQKYQNCQIIKIVKMIKVVEMIKAKFQKNFGKFCEILKSEKSGIRKKKH